MMSSIFFNLAIKNNFRHIKVQVVTISNSSVTILCRGDCASPNFRDYPRQFRNTSILIGVRKFMQKLPTAHCVGAFVITNKKISLAFRGKRHRYSLASRKKRPCKK